MRLLLIDADGNFAASTAKPLTPAAIPIASAACASRCSAPIPPTPCSTTRRRSAPLYALDQLESQRRGFDDVLFLNLRGEVTEGAISNVFIEKDGRWFTPPIECGLLAGVYRRHLLETRPEIEERVLTIDDLRTADAVYISQRRSRPAPRRDRLVSRSPRSRIYSSLVPFVPLFSAFRW